MPCSVRMSVARAIRVCVMLVTAGFAPSTFRFAISGGGGMGLRPGWFGGVEGRGI